jgi:hypothetical protein
VVVPTTDGSSLTCYVPAEHAESNELYICLLVLDRWEARSVTWRSPLGQLRAPVAASWAAGAARAYPHGPWEKLLRAAARQAFWKLPATTLRAIASQELGLELSTTQSLFEVLREVVGGVLECTEEEALDICAKRLAHMSNQAGGFDAVVLEMDEAGQFLDAEGRTEAQATKEVKQHAKDLGAFKGECKATRSSRAKAKAGPKAKAGAGSRGKSSAPGPRWGKYPLVPAGMMTQVEAKRLLPPGRRFGAVSTTARGGCTIRLSPGAALRGPCTGKTRLP